VSCSFGIHHGLTSAPHRQSASPVDDSGATATHPITHTANADGRGADGSRDREREAIEHIRRRFQQQMADEFTSVVEQVTGRKVKVFLSETNIEHDVSVETFLRCRPPAHDRGCATGQPRYGSTLRRSVP
jgi:Na+-translocating membrane potential-generating system (MpsC)